MNKINPKATYESADPKQPMTGITPSQIETLQRELAKGENAVATQRDLIELHKRMVAMFSTLKDGLGEQHAKKAELDRSVLSARLDKMEKAVNRMEGALSIEFAPLVSAAINDALDKKAAAPQRKIWTISGGVVLAVAGLVAGAAFSGELIDLVNKTSAWLFQIVSEKR